MDFVHFEEWEPGIWRYHQAGLNLETTFRLRNLDKVPYARWAITDMPALEDLVGVIRSGLDIRVLRKEHTDLGEAWVLSLQPTHPAAAPETLIGSFYVAKLEPTWTVYLSVKTGLPVRVLIGAPDAERLLEISIRDPLPGVEKRPGDWKLVNETLARVEHRLQGDMDVSSNASIHAALKPLGLKVDAWRQSRYPKKASLLEQVEPGASNEKTLRAPYQPPMAR